MNKAAAVLILLILLLAGSSTYAQIEDELVQDEIKSEIKKYDFGEWNAYFESLPQEIQTLLGENTESMVTKLTFGAAEADTDDVLATVFSMLKASVKENLVPITAVLAVGILSGLAAALGDGFSARQNIVPLICSCVCILMLMNRLAEIVSVARRTVETLGGFTDISTPILTAVIAAAGKVGTSGMLTPLSAFLNTTVAKLFENVVLPLTLALIAIAAINAITAKSGLEHISLLIKTILRWIIGMVFTVYLGMIAVQGIAASGADGVAFQSARFALDKSVPVVGSVVSGTLSTVISCAAMIKNAAGISAVLIAGGYLLMPLLNIGGTILAFKIGAALCEAVSDKKISQLLTSLADACNYLFASVICVGIMFMITLGICIMVGG